MPVLAETSLMDGNGNLENRLTALEEEVAALKRRIGASNQDWLHATSGRMKEIPEEDFQEFVRLGKEFRDAQKDPY